MIRSFDTLAARAILVSLIGITLVHFLSLWTYERTLDRELTIAHETRLAERIIAIKRSVMLVAPEQREAVAHDLSGGPVEAHWSIARGAIAGGPGVEHWQSLASHISRLAPDQKADDVVIGASAGADPHVASCPCVSRTIAGSISAFSPSGRHDRRGTALCSRQR